MATLLMKLPAVEPKIPAILTYVIYTIIEMTMWSMNSSLGSSQRPLRSCNNIEKIMFKTSIPNKPSIVFPGET